MAKGFGKNSGKDFEAKIVDTGRHYCTQGIAYWQKVDPPIVVTRRGAQMTTIQKANPFLDFVGVYRGGAAATDAWRFGRMIQFEAKDCDRTSLPVGTKGGISASQWGAMRNWHSFGAIVFALWNRPGKGIDLFTVPKIKSIMELEGRKSVPWGSGQRVSDTINGRFPFPEILGAYFAAVPNPLESGDLVEAGEVS